MLAVESDCLLLVGSVIPKNSDALTGHPCFQPLQGFEENDFSQTGAGFRSLTEAIDTTTPAGRMMMQIVATFAEFERAMLRERTRKGLEQARSHGRIVGRRPKLKPHQQDEIIRSVQSGKKTAADAARLFNIHPSTVSRLLRKAER
jgi:DNA invertase Pin-like site-specific DNA recombinase